MHVLVRSTSIRFLSGRNPHTLLTCGLLAVSFVTVRPVRAAAPPIVAVDAQLLTDLEHRALTANVKEQALLYAELADKMTLLASRQIADGQIEEAEATLEHMEACTAKMESNLQQSKSLKKTELLLHATNRRLSDMVRAAGMDLKPHVQSALKRLDAAQTSLLALIFAK